jgi:hypothetical protein
MGGVRRLRDTPKTSRCGLLDRVPIFRRASILLLLLPLNLTTLIRDGSGAIDFQEFKNVLSTTMGPDSLPFNFEWWISV